MTGLEPAASWSQTKHSTKLSYIPIYVKSNSAKFRKPFDSYIIIKDKNVFVKTFFKKVFRKIYNKMLDKS